MTRALKPSQAPLKSPDEDEVEAPLWVQIRAAIGADAAARLSAAHGGRRLYIPQAPGPHNVITVAIGADAAQILGAKFASATVDVPLAAGVRARILDLSRQGVQVSRIAEMLRCTERHVYYVRAEAREDGEDPLQPRLI